MPVIEKSFCTTKEAATRLGVSVGTVQLWVESGLLQAWKTAGGHRRVIRESVEGLLHKAPSSAPDLPQPTEAPQTGQRLSVLVVEDDSSLLRLYKAKIAAWPMAPSVELNSNGFAALLTMGRTCPDLLITDLRMPGIDGFAMLRALQKIPEASGTRMVVVSGLDRTAIEAQGGLPDGIEVLSKPVPFERLQQIAAEITISRKRLGYANL
ncbi:excisionase [Rhodoferax lacus]|uniref:Excisionase n=1 Tax=Rhodoferax lacus TaxID=2184758 RepID=A0A3E1RFW6_9BURK|nr:response regulator [Rhodoferax lacus]RFO98153.1 excisionase [Rhodoferax lacus]